MENGNDMINKFIGNLVFFFSKKIESCFYLLPKKNTKITSYTQAMAEIERLEVENFALKNSNQNCNCSVCENERAAEYSEKIREQFKPLAGLLQRKLVAAMQIDELSAGDKEKLKSFIQRFEHVVRNQNSVAVIMDKLAENASHMSRFINLLRDVSDQSNLLAINAAIEVSNTSHRNAMFFTLVDDVIALIESASTAISQLDGLVERMSIPKQFIEMEGHLYEMKSMSKKIISTFEN